MGVTRSLRILVILFVVLMSLSACSRSGRMAVRSVAAEDVSDDACPSVGSMTKSDYSLEFLNELRACCNGSPGLLEMRSFWMKHA